MKDFKGSGRGGGFEKRSFGGRGGNRGGSKPWEKGRGDRQEMFKVRCAECGKETEVPFRPTGDRPVYCRDCFADKQDDGPRDFKKKDFSRRREGGAPESNKGIDNLKAEVHLLHKKIDSLTGMIEKLSTSVTGEIQRESVRDALIKADVLPARKTPTKTAAKKKAPAKKATKKTAKKK
jgi:CxxC-x17-CxxC domain-containing protein